MKAATMEKRHAPAHGALRQRIGWSIGGATFNLYFQTASLLLLFYYTDVLGLSPATAGWVFAGALVWDAAFDPIMGYVANRTRTRWGRYRPYLLLGALPLALSWALVFVPTTLTGAALVLFATFTHILFRTCYAVVNMPYLALSAVITTDSHERGVMAGMGLVASAVASLFVALGTLKFVAAFGGGQSGYFTTAILYGAIASCLLLAVFMSTREKAEVIGEVKPNIADVTLMIASNRAFWIVCAAMLLTSFSGTFFQKTLPYYFKYAVGREDLIGAALGVLATSVMFSVPLWTWVMRRWSKRAMWLGGTAVGLVGSLLMWIAPLAPTPLLLALIPVGVGAGAGFQGFWAMMPDTVEYGEWRTGVRAEGAIFGFVTLVQKASLGLAAAALGELLTVIGYRANAVQTGQTLHWLRIVMIALPAVISVASGLVILFYRLDRRTHQRMTRIIARRRLRASLSSKNRI